jgi:hypothetical protein
MDDNGSRGWLVSRGLAYGALQIYEACTWHMKGDQFIRCRTLKRISRGR